MAMFPKAVTFLGSDSNSKSARLNDKKLLENFQGIDFLFFFLKTETIEKLALTIRHGRTK